MRRLTRPARTPGQWATLTTPERIDRRDQRLAERQQRVEQRGAAVKAFYAQLTPDQQKIFDPRTTHLGAGAEAGHARGRG